MGGPWGPCAGRRGQVGGGGSGKGGDRLCSASTGLGSLITRPLALPCVSPSETLCPPRHSLPVFYFFHPKTAMLAEGICRAGQRPVFALATAARCHPFSHIGHSGPRGTPQSPRVALCHLQGWGTPSSVWPWGEGDTHQARDRRTDGGCWQPTLAPTAPDGPVPTGRGDGDSRRAGDRVSPMGEAGSQRWWQWGGSQQPSLSPVSSLLP